MLRTESQGDLPHFSVEPLVPNEWWVSRGTLETFLGHTRPAEEVSLMHETARGALMRDDCRGCILLDADAIRMLGQKSAVATSGI